MITRLYADNFRSLVNFELDLGRLTLLLGENGSGKSTALDIVDRVTRYLGPDGPNVNAVFEAADFTRWQQHVAPVQTFELDLEVDGHRFRYSLAIEHDRLGRLPQRMTRESLTCDGAQLFDFRVVDGEARAQLYRDDGSKGPDVLADWSRSSLGFLQERQDNRKLVSFRRRLRQTLVVRPTPQCMRTDSDAERRTPDTLMVHFASWLRYLMQARQGDMVDLTTRLREVVRGFRSFSMTEAGDAKLLHVVMQNGGGGEGNLRFDRLSDGERMLVALYTLAGYLREPCTVCIDEPENFLGLPEIQPWLDALRDQLEDADGRQAILVSHHPKMINFLASDLGVWMCRKEGTGPSQAQRVVTGDDETGLSVAKLVEMGWIYDAK